MADSSDIDAAIVGRLLADPTLMGLMPDGVYFDQAAPGKQRFVIVSLVDAIDIAEFQRRAYEDVLYSIKAVALNTSGGDVRAAAARIGTLLEDARFPVTGYTLMTIHREARIREREDDEEDNSLYWSHRGGLYRVQVSL